MRFECQEQVSSDPESDGNVDMLNPRTLWQQWRNNARLTPRFTLKRRQQHQQPTVNEGLDAIDDLNNDIEAVGRARAPVRDGQSQSCLADHQADQRYSHFETPPSPVPNDSGDMITTTPRPILQLSSSQECYEQGA